MLGSVKSSERNWLCTLYEVALTQNFCSAERKFENVKFNLLSRVEVKLNYAITVMIKRNEIGWKTVYCTRNGACHYMNWFGEKKM